MKSFRLLPPIWLLLCILLAVGLHRYFPMTIMWTAPASYLGIIPIILGLGLAIWGAGLFSKFGTPVVPFRESTALVTSGPFRISRNPMYLGMGMILTGIAIGLGSATPFLAIVLFFGLIRDLFVIPEEAILKERFGEEYEDYCQRVRRWI